MTLPVVVTEPAQRELEAAARWWAKNRSRAQALRWYNGFVKALKSLSTGAGRCGLARENDAFPFEIRELHYGIKGRPTHRAVFAIRPEMILVLAIRHVAQADLSPNGHN